MHDGPSPGPPKAIAISWKHGRYTAAAIARRRKLNDFLRMAAAFLRES
jgi:hypothetical protein